MPALLRYLPLSNTPSPPSGPAGGSLAGTYPNPTIAPLVVTDAEVAAANKDGLAATFSMRTLGTGALQACAGNDSRLSDSRTPTGAAGGSLAGTYPNPTIAALPVTTRSAAGALPTTDAIVLVNTSGGAFALSLPNPALFVGRLLYLLDSTGSFATNNMTLTRFGAEQISGLAASRIFQTAWGGWIVLTNGTDWFVI